MEKVGNALALKVPRFCNAEPFTKSGAIGLPQHPDDFLRGKYIVFTLLAIAVRILGAVKASVWRSHFRKNIGCCLLRNFQIKWPSREFIGFAVDDNQQSVII